MERASMDLSRLLVGAGALGLLGSLFLPWFRISSDYGGPQLPGIQIAYPTTLYTGWEAFAVADILLTLIAAGALLGFGLALALGARWPLLGVAALGWAAVVLTLFAVYYPASVPALGNGSLPQAGFLGSLLSGGAIAGGALWAGLVRPPD
jgi:hypothetical protein